MSLRHYVTSVHIKKVSRLVGYIECEDVGGGVTTGDSPVVKCKRLCTLEWLQKKGTARALNVVTQC